MPDASMADPGSPYTRLRAPGEIQSFGVLLTLHPTTMRVLNASGNVGAELGIPHADMIGKSLAEFVEPADIIAEIRAALAEDAPVFVNPLPISVHGRRFDLIMHAHEGLIFAEFEKLAPGAATRADMDRLTDEAIAGMMLPDNLEALTSAGLQEIRSATQFDRVLLYRFDEAYRGQVIGESRQSGVESFLGLFFPENDIGPPARALYTENFCRYIPHIDAASVRILPAENPLTHQPLDMSHAILRAVAPCHIDYLKNMGVAASMSFSIVSEGKLWGLFACHHYGPTQLSYTQRLVCEQIAMMFAAKIQELVNPVALEADMQARCSAVLSSSPLLRGAALQQEWRPEDERALLDLVNAEGAAFYSDGQVGEIGICPDLGELHAYISQESDAFNRLLHMYDDDGLYYTSSVAEVLPFGARMRTQGSGMMVVPLARKKPEFLLWFRPEMVINATWAGNPADSQVKDPNARYSPRRSFAAWKEDIRDRSAPWTKLDIANAVALRDRVLASRN
jgi:light-regulated signal transduction histidine kinase (bacteriophytochrome)